MTARSGFDIRSQRERAGLSQWDVARAAGVNQITVSRVERGDITAPATLAAIRAAIVAIVTKRISDDCRMVAGSVAAASPA